MPQELADFTAALADQGKHDDVGQAAIADHAEQRALAAPGRREDADPLTPAAGQQTIDRPHAKRQRRIDQRSFERIRHPLIQAAPCACRRERHAVERPSHAVEHPAGHERTHRDPVRPPQRPHQTAGDHARRGGKRRQQGKATPYGDDFRLDAGRFQPAHFPEADAGQRRPHHRGADIDHAPEAGLAGAVVLPVRHQPRHQQALDPCRVRLAHVRPPRRSGRYCQGPAVRTRHPVPGTTGRPG